MTLSWMYSGPFALVGWIASPCVLTAPGGKDGYPQL
jgi:hypothetical protein